jgi:beta-lactamase regulating signal transducer with metallopeptidase domain
MSQLADQVLFNLAIATVLACFAYLSRFLGRPALTHVLWLIVLTRLLIPPVWSVPRLELSPGPASTAAPLLNMEEPLYDDESPIPIEELPPQAVPVVEQTPTSEKISSINIPLALIASSTWAAIAVSWCGLMLFRAARFHYLLLRADSATHELTELVGKLARHLGLKRIPRVVTVPMSLSPCVWCFGRRPVLLMPRDWCERLGKLERAAIIVHELAHLKRGDHWVRWFEILVTSLYWWLPIVWLARRELREAEEQCCDAWVVAMLPAARRVYANTLIDMADYLKPLRPALPPLCSGFGQVHELRRRVHMILKSKPALRPGRAGAAIALGLGLFLMPVGMARSDDEKEQPRPKAGRREPGDQPPSESRERERERQREMEERERVRVRDDRRSAEIDKLRDELAQSQKRLEEAQKMVERLRAHMGELRDRMRELGVETREGGRVAGRGGEPGRPGTPPEPPRGGRGENAPELPRTPRPPREPDAPRAAEPPRTPRPAEVPGTPGPGGARFGGFGGGFGGPRAPAEARIEQLEKQLTDLMSELKAIRREMSERRTTERREPDRRPSERPPGAGG